MTNPVQFSVNSGNDELNVKSFNSKLSGDKLLSIDLEFFSEEELKQAQESIENNKSISIRLFDGKLRLMSSHSLNRDDLSITLNVSGKVIDDSIVIQQILSVA